jgi:N-acetylneuraminate synthase
MEAEKIAPTPSNPVEIIAEIGQAHEGSLGMAHAYIDALADTGVDTIKFQVHLAAAESSAFEPFRVPFSYEDKSRYHYWQRMEFTPEQWAGLKIHCTSRGVKMLASPFSLAAVHLLEKLDIDRYKIGSGETGNFLLLQAIAQTTKPILLSTGMSSWQELDDTLAFLKRWNNPLTLLQCTTAYPTQPGQWGLNVLQELRHRYALPVGFSDHSGDIYAGLAAATLGACVLECHVVFDKKMFGPDTPASITVSQMEQLVAGIRQITTALQSPVQKNQNSGFSELKQMFGKSLAVNKNLPAGHLLTLEDLESKKPAGYGIAAADYHTVLGRRLKHEMEQYQFLTEADLA